jgi:DNA polymerase-3 subunit epsilon
VLGSAWTDAEFASLDFETTGLEPSSDDVVSFGVVPILEGRIVLREAVYRQVSPAADLTGRSVVIHGIRPVDLRSAPSIEDAQDELASALEQRVILAWAAEVEAAFLAKIFGGSARSWRRRIVDVLRLAILVHRRERGSDADRLTLAGAARHYGVPVEQPHHAFDDALTTAQLFLVLMSRLPESRLSTPRRLLRASRRRHP